MAALSAEDSATNDLSALQEALGKNPEDISSYTRLGWALFSLEKFEDAVATFQSAYQRWPNEIEVNYGLGLALKLQGDRNRAVESFVRAEAIEPKSVRSSMMQTLAREQKEYLLQKV
jgi:cytochrome c-type biogenesis protein CcmH/NrfG